MNIGLCCRMPERDTCDLLCLDLPKAEALRAALPDPEELEAASLPFKALTDPTRLAVVLSLAEGGSCCVCDLAWVVGREEKLVSHHVRPLKSLGVARSRRDGRMVMYELTELGVRLAAAHRTVARVTA
jgi:DNA-binding transcriptional ArsR family regulator